ncbi:MAG TPA: hypothetical protein PL063_02135 [Candidatus Cloacimonadota bacterium]|jgi:hypothetical protein|nr:hypothetical protein [Candidatus Cloacimonadales bacterium]HPY95993.1 hypothetical protein [Candidatus Cloacimonadota bacterium]HQB40599.1 hypothetical protein [Candidatus Cloacimonadota bacterium]
MIFIVSVLIILGVLIFYRTSTPQLSLKKRIILAIIRSLYAIIICIFLFNPILHFVKNKRIDDKTIIIVDDSESMTIKQNGVKKADLIKQINDQLVNTLKANNNNYEVYKLSDYNALKTKSTYLMPFLEYIQTKNSYQNIKTIFFLSDGWVHDDNLQPIVSLNIPVYTFNVDAPEDNKDLRIEDLRYNKTAYQNELTTISTLITSKNIKSTAQLKLVIDGKTVQEKSINVSTEQTIELDFEVMFNKIGLIPFSVEIIAKDDVYLENNLMSGAIQVVESKQKIAIISDVLNYDLTFISQLFHDSKRYNLDIIYQKRNQFYKNSKPYNLNIKDYSSLILINNGTLSFNTNVKDDIVKMMQDNFGIISIGYPVKGLQEILPVTQSNIKDAYRGNFRVSGQAEQYKVFEELGKNIQNTPIVTYLYLSIINQGQALSFIENESASPWIVYRSYLNSHIFHICGFDLWKWKTITSADDYDNFMNGLVDWVSRKNSERFYAYTDKNSYLFGESLIIKLNAYDETFNPLSNINPSLQLKIDNKLIKDEFLSLSNNQYQLKLENLKPGKYDYTVIEKEKMLQTSSSFIISKKDRELFETGFNSNMLAMISNLSKGKFITVSEINDYLPKSEPHIYVPVKTEVLFYQKWYIILLFILLVATEYFLRKKWGLI